MPTPTDDRRDLLTVVAYMRAASGKGDELREALEALVEPTSREKGYINYDLHQSVSDPDMFFFYENWESEADLDAHLAAPHLTAFAARIPELLDEQGLTVNRVRRIA
jgi:quinol monooxygenase YgiN